MIVLILLLILLGILDVIIEKRWSLSFLTIKDNKKEEKAARILFTSYKSVDESNRPVVVPGAAKPTRKQATITKALARANTKDDQDIEAVRTFDDCLDCYLRGCYRSDVTFCFYCGENLEPFDKVHSIIDLWHYRLYHFSCFHKIKLI